MNPYHSHDLQVPVYTPDGYVITSSNGDTICLSHDGNYAGMEFAEVDFSFLTIRADFTKATFKHCLFNLTDMSGSSFSEASFHDCIMNSVAFMWTNSFKLKMTETSVSDIRFYSSNLQQAHIEANFTEAKFTHVNLSGAHFINCSLNKSEFTDGTCTDMTISHTALDAVEFKNCDMRWFQVVDSTADFWRFNHCNLSGSTWRSVVSTVGYWKFHHVNLSAARFSMCHAKNTKWSHTTFFGVVMECCNWFKSSLDLCVILNSTFTHVGFNETNFTNSGLQDVQALGLRLRYAKFNNCEISDTTIADSFWEFCEFRLISAENLTITNPAYSEGTQWHAGFVPTSSPNPTPTDSSEEDEEEEETQ
jgi:uncharacterized protein YjbI with pentapeptide repeats